MESIDNDTIWGISDCKQFSLISIIIRTRAIHRLESNYSVTRSNRSLLLPISFLNWIFFMHWDIFTICILFISYRCYHCKRHKHISFRTQCIVWWCCRCCCLFVSIIVSLSLSFDCMECVFCFCFIFVLSWFVLCFADGCSHLLFAFCLFQMSQRRVIWMIMWLLKNGVTLNKHYRAIPKYYRFGWHGVAYNMRYEAYLLTV